jgi:carbon-monoxide dehydrogenase medium subunit
VKAPPFRYHRPDTLAEALALLAEHGDDAKVLAGGQSLVPLMAMRMGRPAVVVDIGRVPGLGDIEVGVDRTCSIGALVRHAAAERSADVATHAPLVHRAMPLIAHRAIRTRGTVVGSIAHADPAAEMPAVAVAVGATMTAVSASGERTIPASDFFEGYLQTALRADEILTRVSFPAWPSGAVGSVVEVARRHGDYALVGLVTKIELDGDTISSAALTFFGAASTPIRVAEAAALVAEALDPPADLHGTTAYRKHLAAILTRRGLAEAASTIGASV